MSEPVRRQMLLTPYEARAAATLKACTPYLGKADDMTAEEQTRQLHAWLATEPDTHYCLDAAPPASGGHKRFRGFVCAFSRR